MAGVVTIEVIEPMTWDGVTLLPGSRLQVDIATAIILVRRGDAKYYGKEYAVKGPSSAT